MGAAGGGAQLQLPELESGDSVPYSLSCPISPTVILQELKTAAEAEAVEAARAKKLALERMASNDSTTDKVRPRPPLLVSHFVRGRSNSRACVWQQCNGVESLGNRCSSRQMSKCVSRKLNW